VADYYKWYREDRRGGSKRDLKSFLFGIKRPKSKNMREPWVYLTLETSEDELSRLWINDEYVSPRELIVRRECKSDKEYLGRYLKGNKGKFIVQYFNMFGPG